ncbi:MAG: class I SAM-dependent methyltransferase [Bacteroidota bacterium]
MLHETTSIKESGYTLMDNAYQMILSDDIYGGMEYLIFGMNAIKKEFGTNEWQEFSQVTFLNHPIVQLVHQCPFTFHSFSKPRGYAGDAELLDYIYDFKQLSPDLSVLGKKILTYNRQMSAPCSVRSRRDILAKTIDATASEVNHPAQILSIACGHLREAQKSIAIQENVKNIGSFFAFDQDPLSLNLIDAELSNSAIETIQGSVTKLVRQKQTFENLDLVYAAGLYDYLSQPFATRLTSIMFEMLRPGGKLLIANFMPDHRDIGYMETFMQWPLIYRDESQLNDVSKEISDADIDHKNIFLEENGNIVFLELRKS